MGPFVGPYVAPGSSKPCCVFPTMPPVWLTNDFDIGCSLDLLLVGHLTRVEPGVGQGGALDGHGVLHPDDVDLNLPGLFLQDLSVLLPLHIPLFVELTGHVQRLTLQSRGVLLQLFDPLDGELCTGTTQNNEPMDCMV